MSIGDEVAKQAGRLILMIVGVCLIVGALAGHFLPRLLHHISIHWK